MMCTAGVWMAGVRFGVGAVACKKLTGYGTKLNIGVFFLNRVQVDKIIKVNYIYELLRYS